jgi:hypothetical protein
MRTPKHFWMGFCKGFIQGSLVAGYIGMMTGVILNLDALACIGSTTMIIAAAILFFKTP